jgi:hypothetical protein
MVTVSDLDADTRSWLAAQTAVTLLAVTANPCRGST